MVICSNSVSGATAIEKAFFFLSCLLWDWALTWGVYFFGPFVYFIDFLLSAMEGFRLPVGGGVGSSIPDLNVPPIPDLNGPPPEAPLPQPAEDVYHEKDPDRIKAILERKKAERDASAVSNTKAEILTKIKEIVEGVNHQKKEECISEVNKNFLKRILENKKVERAALKGGLNQIYTARKGGYLSNKSTIKDLIKKDLDGDL